MKIRTRIFLVFTLVTALGVYGLVSWMQEEMRPRYLEAQEDPLVDMAQTLATLIETQGLVGAGEQIRPDPVFLQAAFGRLAERQLQARIYALEKHRVDVRVYVTDRHGVVVFDSDNDRDLGVDYSRWRDVRLTLAREYGARSTPGDPIFAKGATMYVAAPVELGDQIVGVVSVGKPTRNAERFLKAALRELANAGVIAALLAVLIALVLYWWVSRPLKQLHDYARAVEAGERLPPPDMGRNEIGQVADGISAMRKALDGKAYVEDYVQALTHELKSPTAAIRGAAELLDEDMPEQDKRRFLDNIRRETERLQDILDRLLDLAAIENRSALEQATREDMSSIVASVVESLAPVAAVRAIELVFHPEAEFPVRADRLLVEQAVGNLLKNAIEFSPTGAPITLELRVQDREVELSIHDRGPGIPEYARDRLFERFYSLPRPDSAKSTGLGLSFVKEIAALHRGSIDVGNAVDGGAVARFALPLI